MHILTQSYVHVCQQSLFTKVLLTTTQTTELFYGHCSINSYLCSASIRMCVSSCMLCSGFNTTTSNCGRGAASPSSFTSSPSTSTPVPACKYTLCWTHKVHKQLLQLIQSERLVNSQYSIELPCCSYRSCHTKFTVEGVQTSYCMTAISASGIVRCRSTIASIQSYINLYYTKICLRVIS